MATMGREVTKFSIAGGAEEAITGWWWFSGPGVGWGDITADIGDAFTDAYWWENSTPLDGRAVFGSSVAIAQRYFEEVDVATGDVISVHPLQLPADLPGQSAAGSLPAEVSMCVSVRSGLTDRKSNGRFYLPPPSVDNLTGPGNFSTASITTMVDALGNYFQAVSNGANSTQLGTYSRTDHAFYAAHAINVGSVPDAQRRRRNSLVESRVTFSL